MAAGYELAGRILHTGKTKRHGERTIVSALVYDLSEMCKSVGRCGLGKQFADAFEGQLIFTQHGGSAMMKFSDNYIKWGVTILTIFSVCGWTYFIITGLVGVDGAKMDLFDGIVFVFFLLLSFVPLVFGRDTIYRTVFVDEEGVRKRCSER